MHPSLLANLQHAARVAGTLPGPALKEALLDVEAALEERLSPQDQRTLAMIRRALQAEKVRRQRAAMGAGPDEDWSDDWSTSGSAGSASAKDAAKAAAEASKTASGKASKTGSSGKASTPRTSAPASPPTAEVAEAPAEDSGTSPLLAPILGGTVALAVVLGSAELYRQHQEKQKNLASKPAPKPAAKTAARQDDEEDDAP